MTTRSSLPLYSLGPDVCAWIERHCVYPADRWIGQPFVLLPWQKRFIYRLFACDEDGVLTYRWALLGIPKKNGKTSLAAALGLYHVFGDEHVEDPWAVCGASSDNQADLVFGAATRMIENSPTLSKVATLFRSTIIPRRGLGKLERVAAAKGKNDGKNISFAILDELHEWNEIDWTVLTNGTAGRQRAQIVQITTAGFELDSVCGREYEKGLAIQAGEIDNPTYLFEWYGAPEGADHSDPEVWRAANPSYGSLVNEAQLRDKFLNNREPDFRRYFLNQWVLAESPWVSRALWDDNADSEAVLMPGEDTWVAWDASTKRDSTAVAVAQWEQGEYVSPDDELDDDGEPSMDVIDDDVLRALRRTRGRLRLHVEIWERPRLPDGNYDPTWKLPIGEVENYVRSLARLYRVQEIAYDPAFITWSAATLEVEGLPMEEFPQSDARMCPATQVAYELLVARRLAHEDEEVLARHVASTATAPARSGAVRAVKARAKKPMDGAIATIMVSYRAVKGLLKKAEGPPNVW